MVTRPGQHSTDLGTTAWSTTAMDSESSSDGQALDMALLDLPGETLEDKLNYAIKQDPIVILGKTTCPFCIEARRTFDNLGVPYTPYDLDVVAEGVKAHALLKAGTGQNTVPYVFIGGKLLGGCDATKAAQANGSLLKMLAALSIFPKAAGHASMGAALLQGTPRAMRTLFSFPEVTDDRAARFNGVWGFVVCLLVAIFYNKTQAHWVMGGLMVDFVLRFLGGGNISPLGSLSAVCCAVMELFGSKPRWVAGQSKQFASLCGIMFSALAFLFFLLGVYNDKLVKVGLAFTCGLGAATFMEGFLGFCLGCYIFSWAVKLNVLPSEVFMLYTNTRDEVAYTWEDMNKRLNEGHPSSHRHTLHPDGKTETQVDYKYKAKTDDMTREDVHVIKHVKITHFMMHLAITGLASAWKVASQQQSLHAPAPVSYAIALAAALFFVTWLCLYALKCFFYPGKVYKEWMHNVAGNAFILPFVITILFAFLVKEHSDTFAHVLFWIGAPAGLLLSIIKVGDWIALRKDMEHLNASWIIMPVANAIAALVGPKIEPTYRDACQLWFAFAFMMWVLLFAATFLRSIIHTEEEDRYRPMLGVWVAAPAVLAVAYTNLFPAVVLPGAAFNDFVFIMLHWFALSLVFILGWTFVRPFMGRMQFEMPYWAGGFPLDAVAMTCMTYYMLRPGGLSQGIAFTALAAASCVNCTLLLQMLAALLRRRIFVPEVKWGPLSFMRLTHEAFRVAMKRILNMAEVAASCVVVSVELVESISQELAMLSRVQAEHAKHEDQVAFRLYEEFYPGVSSSWVEEHRKLQEAIQQLVAQVQALKCSPTQTDADALLTALREYANLMESNLKGEEDHLIGMPRKHINLALHKEAVRKCWSLTPAATWYELLPWIVNNLPMLHQRVRFIKTLLWALPERGQHIGMMVGMGVDAVQWRRVTDELPEIIPRGAEGWERYY